MTKGPVNASLLNNVRTKNIFCNFQDEIKAYQDTEKMMHLRSRLYNRCGVVLDDTGQIAEDKAVQVDVVTGELLLLTLLSLEIRTHSLSIHYWMIINSCSQIIQKFVEGLYYTHEFCLVRF